MKVLFLDDSWKRKQDFSKLLPLEASCKFVETTQECISALISSDFDFIFLDHDLYGQKRVPSGVNTGYEIADYLVNSSDLSKNALIVVHSKNEVGAANMMVAFEGSRKAVKIPFLEANFDTYIRILEGLNNEL